MPTDLIQGHCPMGCGRTLFIGAGGYITCFRQACPQPDAVATLLEDRESEHIVRVDPEDFTVRHPLRERLGDALMRCDLHRWIADQPGPPRRVGTYRVVWRSDPATPTWTPR